MFYVLFISTCIFTFIICSCMYAYIYILFKYSAILTTSTGTMSSEWFKPFPPQPPTFARLSDTEQGRGRVMRDWWATVSMMTLRGTSRITDLLRLGLGWRTCNQVRSQFHPSSSSYEERQQFSGIKEVSRFFSDSRDPPGILYLFEGMHLQIGYLHILWSKNANCCKGKTTFEEQERSI